MTVNSRFLWRSRRCIAESLKRTICRIGCSLELYTTCSRRAARRFRCSISPVGTRAVRSTHFEGRTCATISVDLAEPALSVVSRSARSLGCASQVIHQDFQEYVNAASRRWDIIFIGFSFHHLETKAKVAFAPEIRRALSTGGEWIFFEPMLDGDETRQEFLDRWKASLEHDWQEFTPEEKMTIWEHVSQDDFPENLSTFERIALEGGFRILEHLYTDPCRFYGAFRALV